MSSENPLVMSSGIMSSLAHLLKGLPPNRGLSPGRASSWGVVFQHSKRRLPGHLYLEYDSLVETGGRLGTLLHILFLSSGFCAGGALKLFRKAGRKSLSWELLGFLDFFLPLVRGGKNAHGHGVLTICRHPQFAALHALEITERWPPTR